ncbi:MAG: polysaccharide biosynthesis protein [Acidobacteriota bacterium]
MSTNDSDARPLEGARILVTGGTGSLGKVLVRRLLAGEMGRPSAVVVFSRDELKQHDMRLAWQARRRAAARAATDEVIYGGGGDPLRFCIGDVRDVASLERALLAHGVQIVVHAAALKQVPTCEYFPGEAAATNVGGAENLVRALARVAASGQPVDTVVGISTDKACKPVNVMGMTKALMERILIRANLDLPRTRLLCVRYGNVLASRGSVIPLFHEQLRRGGPLTLTDPDMTRFLLSLDDAVDTVFAAIRTGRPGELYVPRAPAAKIVDVAAMMAEAHAARTGAPPVPVESIGIRPGEKLHESMLSIEEGPRVVRRGAFYALRPMLPELAAGAADLGPPAEEVAGGFSSADHLRPYDETRALLERHDLLRVPDAADARPEVGA